MEIDLFKMNTVTDKEVDDILNDKTPPPPKKEMDRLWYKFAKNTKFLVMEED